MSKKEHFIDTCNQLLKENKLREALLFSEERIVKNSRAFKSIIGMQRELKNIEWFKIDNTVSYEEISQTERQLTIRIQRLLGIIEDCDLSDSPTLY
jgi:hypothetical protein